MRLALRFSALILLLPTLARAADQPLVYEAVVVVDNAEVRCKPSTKDNLGYSTNKLRRGDRVEVRNLASGELEDGWLAITPPRGSISWISTVFVQKLNGTTWVVRADPDAPVYCAPLQNEKPTVTVTRVKNGEQLIGTNRKMETGDGVWLPIAPPPSEVRFIRASSVQSAETKRNGALVAMEKEEKTSGDPRLVPQASEKGEASDADRRLPRPTAGQAGKLVEAASQAQRGGDYPKACRLWTEAGQEFDRIGDKGQKDQCYNMADWLSRRLRPTTQPNCQTPCVPCWPATMDTRIRPIPVKPVQPLPVRPATYIKPLETQGSGSDPGLTVSTNPPATQWQPASTTQAPLPPNQDSWNGTLIRPPGKLDYEQTYLLEDSNAHPIAYVRPKPGAGVDLDKYVGRNVKISGTVDIRKTSGTKVITATQVWPF